jgi:hypothetical protein
VGTQPKRTIEATAIARTDNKQTAIVVGRGGGSTSSRLDKTYNSLDFSDQRKEESMNSRCLVPVLVAGPIYTDRTISIVHMFESKCATEDGDGGVQ